VTVVYILAAAAVGVAGLVGLLRLAKAATDRLIRDDGTPAPGDVPPLVVPGHGWLNDDEEQEQARRQAAAAELEAAIGRDVARMDAAERVMRHRLNVLFEKTLSQLGLDQLDRNWARLTSGEYQIVGVA
jgi:hypothetical protein